MAINAAGAIRKSQPPHRRKFRSLLPWLLAVTLQHTHSMTESDIENYKSTAHGIRVTFPKTPSRRQPLPLRLNDR